MMMRVVFLEGLGSVKNDEGCFSRRIRFRNWVNLDALSRIFSPLPEQFQVYLFVILWQILFSYYFFHFIIALRTRFVRWERNRFVFVCVSLYIRNIFSIEAIYPSLVSWEIICTTVRRRGHTQNMLQSTINDTKVINKYWILYLSRSGRIYLHTESAYMIYPHHGFGWLIIIDYAIQNGAIRCKKKAVETHSKFFSHQKFTFYDSIIKSDGCNRAAKVVHLKWQPF